MVAICASSWRSPAAGVRFVEPLDLLGLQLEVVGGSVLLDAGDALGAGDRGDVVALSEQPGQGHLCRCGARLGGDGVDFVDDAQPRQNEISISQNETNKQLTLVATIFLPLSFIVGFFGMNFGWMVGQLTSLWTFVVHGVGSLLGSCAALYVWFRRRGYL
jgi:hypothetical protein